MLWTFTFSVTTGSGRTDGLAAKALVELANVASAAEALEDDLNAGDSEKETSLGESSPARAAEQEKRHTPAVLEVKANLGALNRKTKAVLHSLYEFVKRETTAHNIDRVKEEWREITKILNAFAFITMLIFTVGFIIMCCILWTRVDY